MNKRVIFVKNKEESEKVQRQLFAAGIKWHGPPGQEGCVHYTDYQFLYVRRGILSGDYSFHGAVNSVKNQDTIPLDARMVSDHFKPLPPETMITIDGKEYSESTIKAALKQYVD